MSAFGGDAVGDYYDAQGGETSHWLISEAAQNPVAYQVRCCSYWVLFPHRASVLTRALGYWQACSAGAFASQPNYLNELGFRSYYENTRHIPASQTYNRPGMGDGAKFGVIGDTSTEQAGDNGQGGLAPHGHQYFMMEDTGETYRDPQSA